jgi:hypothetical protein
LCSGRGVNWPELLGKYILAALKNAMLEWPTDDRRTPALVFCELEISPSPSG